MLYLVNRRSAHRPFLLLFTVLLFSPALTAQTFPSEVQAIIERYVEPNEENHNYRIRRDEWLESMHNCEPGLNWRIVDRENRRAISSLRTVRRDKGFSVSLQGVPDTVPGVIAGNWRERGSDNLSGRIVHADVDLDRGLIYAASGGGNIWRGTMQGQEWKSLNDTTRMQDIRLLRLVPGPQGSRIVAASSGPATVWLSDDDGNSWHRSTGLDDISGWGWWRKGVALADQARTIYLLGSQWDWEEFKSKTVLYRSVDACDSFTVVKEYGFDSEITDIWAPLYDGTMLLMLHRDTLSRVEQDGSLTQLGLMNVEGDFNRFNRCNLAGTLAGGRLHLYAFLQTASDAECFVSQDTGRTWFPRDTLVQPFSANSIAVSTVDPAAAFLGGVDCHRSYEAGAEFNEISRWSEYYGDPVGRLHADIFGIQPFRNRDGSEFLLISTDGGIYISRDTLRSVRNLSLKGLNVSQYYSTLTNWRNPSICHAGSQDQGYQRTDQDNGGILDFNQEISGDYGHLTTSDSGQTVWMNYPGFTLLAREEEGGGVGLLAYEFPGNERLWLPPVVADPANPNVAYLVGGSSAGRTYSRLWRLEASETEITSTELPYDFRQGAQEGELSAFAISPLDKQRWYAMTTDGRFFSSTNTGQAWEKSQDSAQPGNHYFYGAVILPSPKNANRIYVAGSGYSTAGVRVSVDGGRTFQSITDGLPQTMVYDLAVDPDDHHVFAATEVGPYVFSTLLQKWFYLGGVSAPDQTYWSVEYIPTTHTVRFGTYGRGIWDFVVDRASSAPRGTPARSLRPITVTAGNNPASSETTISFTMPTAGHTVVRIYDMMGREAAKLLDRHLGAGPHRVSWDLRSSSGVRLPSGSYTCVVASGGDVGFMRVEVVR